MKVGSLVLWRWKRTDGATIGTVIGKEESLWVEVYWFSTARIIAEHVLSLEVVGESG